MESALRAWNVVVFRLSIEDGHVLQLMRDFRLMVNKAIRFGLMNHCSSLGSICRGMYHGLRVDHHVYSQHVSQACAIGASILRNHRNRSRRSLGPKPPPFVRRLFIRMENQAYDLDRASGRLRFPIRAGQHILIQLPMSEYHRSILSDSNVKLGSLTLTKSGAALAFSKDVQREFAASSLLALDTNESSLDGVLADASGLTSVRASFPEIRQIQATPFRRRRRLSGKKAHDLRTQRALISREGPRERRRVNYRIHELTSLIVQTALERRSAIVIEDLRGLRPRARSQRMNRRLGHWPRHRIHFQLEYKARWQGSPLIKVNPKNKSRTCPACGSLNNSRRVRPLRDGMFRCRCGWIVDRHVNAALNILKTALASNEALARDVRFQPGAMRHDVVSLSRPAMVRGRGAERSESIRVAHE